MYQQIGAGDELYQEVFPPLYGRVISTHELVVRDVRQLAAGELESISEGERGVAHPQGSDSGMPLLQRALPDAPVGDASLQGPVGDGEVYGIHLTAEEGFHTSTFLSRSQDAKVEVWVLDRTEERETLDMVPVEVAQEEVARLPIRSGKHLQAKFPNPRAGIEDEALCIRFHLHARGVPTITLRALPGRGYGSPAAPISNPHGERRYFRLIFHCRYPMHD
jgi:hypothetical protein